MFNDLGAPLDGRFWDTLAFSRVISGRRDLEGVFGYLDLNEMEAQGVWRREWDPKRRRRKGAPDRAQAPP